MESSSASDRRKFGRIATDQVISFAPVENRDLLGVSRNVSAGGIRFEAVGCEVNLGDVLRVTFNVGEHTVIAVAQSSDRVESRARGPRSYYPAAPLGCTSSPK